MKLENRLDETSDDALLERLGSLVRRQNALTAELLAHIGEVDRRRLYLREACSLMHRYRIDTASKGWDYPTARRISASTRRERPGGFPCSSRWSSGASFISKASR